MALVWLQGVTADEISVCQRKGIKQRENEAGSALSTHTGGWWGAQLVCWHGFKLLLCACMPHVASGPWSVAGADPALQPAATVALVAG